MATLFFRNGKYLPFLLFVCSILFGSLHAEVIATYLTLENDPLHEMTINWITTQDNHNNRLEYCKEGDHGWFEVDGIHLQLPYNSSHILHKVFLKELTPNSIYLFRLNRSDEPSKFKTLPQNLDKPLRFIVGGDIYHNELELVKEMNRTVADQSPDFVLLGGDLAYASRSYRIGSDRMDRWIEFFQAWSETMKTPDGRMIPMKAILGNHEVNGGFGQTPMQALGYYSFFLKPGDIAYGALDFGSYLSIFYLDSDHTNSVQGAQTRWLADALEKREKVEKKMAIYHVPAFPSKRDFSYSTSKVIRQYWVPLFDKHKLICAFEHHDHCYKRTLPITNLRVNPRGVVYIGDGAWGVKKPRKPNTPRSLWYLAKSMSTRNVVMVDVSAEGTLFQAMDNTGRIFDRFRIDQKS